MEHTPHTIEVSSPMGTAYVNARDAAESIAQLTGADPEEIRSDLENGTAFQVGNVTYTPDEEITASKRARDAAAILATHNITPPRVSLALNWADLDHDDAPDMLVDLLYEQNLNPSVDLVRVFWQWAIAASESYAGEDARTMIDAGIWSDPLSVTNEEK